jgi:hypothetical protein
MIKIEMTFETLKSPIVEEKRIVDSIFTELLCGIECYLLGHVLSASSIDS